jgi:virulence-associated protein VagC
LTRSFCGAEDAATLSLIALPGAFKASDAQAVRIPGELAYTGIDVDLEISRFGDVITIFPARNAPDERAQVFADLSCLRDGSKGMIAHVGMTNLAMLRRLVPV